MAGPTPVAQATAPELEPIDDALREDLRFAVVLNGGVSLAIWMGGATHELHRLTRSQGGAYRELLDWVMSDARVDVISGTSAGGINGAALALGQCNDEDDGTRLSQLRKLWLDNGSFQNLLREPFQGSPTSLLQGDEFFLPEINRALRQLTHPYRPRGMLEQPIDLTITTTLLRGVPGVVVDSAGQQVGQVRHDGLFRFRRGLTHPQRGDDFGSVEEASGLGDVVDALALAARSTASYPLAFEASYLPTSSERAGKPTDLHADVSSYLSGAWDQSQGGEKRARYGADGGALANTPTRPAMEAIDAMPVRGCGLVRRVMLLVHPHAPPIEEDTHDTPDDPPTLVRTGASLVAAVRSEGSRNLVDLVERHNQLAGGRRDLRGDLVRLQGGPDLEERASAVYVLYRRQRLRTMAGELATIWLDRPRETATGGDGATERFPTVLPRVLAALEDACSDQLLIAATATGTALLPFLPPAADEPSPGDQQVASAGADDEEDEGGDGDGDGVLADPGQLGIEAAIGIADAAVDYLRRAMWRVVTGDDPALRDQVILARRQVSLRRTQILRIQEDYLAERRSGLPAQTGGSGSVELQEWTHEALQREQALQAALRPRLEHIAKAVLAARLPPTDTGTPGDDASVLEGFIQVLFTEDGTTWEQVLERLTALEVLTAVVSSENPSGSSLPLSLVQLTFQVRHPFAPSTMTGGDKVAGDQVARFSGFLKRSWRLNDWIWGRLDASRVLCQTVLDPARVRRFVELQLASGATYEQLAEHALRLAVGSERPQDQLDGAAVGLGLPTVRTLADELEALHQGAATATGPAALAELTKVFAVALALEIAAEEMPLLPPTVEQDLKAGAAERARGTLAVGAAKDVFVQAGKPEATPAERWQALEEFATSGIGQESLASEATSDSFIHTAATAAANLVTMLDSPRSGLPAVKPLTRVLRGAALLPYWAVRGLTGGNTVARSLAQLTLAIGGVLVVLGLLGAAPTWATTAGIGAVLIAFAYGALRSGTILHSVVLLVPALIVLGLTLVEVADPDAPASQEQSSVVVLAAIALVLGLFLLGSLRAPLEPPWTWVSKSVRAARGWVVVLLLGGALVWWLQPHAAWEAIVDGWREVVPWLQERWLTKPGQVAWLSEPWRGAPRGVVGLAVLAVLGLVAVRLVVGIDRDPTRRRHDVSTAGWSWLYGVVAAAFSVVLLLRVEAATDGNTVVIVSLLAAAALFLLVVPLRLLFRRG